MSSRPAVTPVQASLLGALGLACAMGIGRFAFTPVLPLMQAEGLGLAQGGVLAFANYLGYLAGALACLWLNPAPGAAARAGLLVVGVVTAAMGATDTVLAWWLLRFLAGIASAFVLVGISAWALALGGRPGWVFAGVGLGIVVAGLGGALAVLGAARSSTVWWGLGVLALVLPALAWRWFRASTPAGVVAGDAPRTPAPATASRVDAQAWRMVLCYGVLGYGYIIPATFLPALGRQWFADPSAFVWAWPVFGLAAAASTLAAAPWLRRAGARGPWAISLVVMALGVLAPVMTTSPMALIVSAVCVGGTFMVATMAGLQEARRLGTGGGARLMAAMTAAFATGQCLGPLAVSALATRDDAYAGPALAAVLMLSGAAATLWRDRAPAPVRHQPWSS